MLELFKYFLLIDFRDREEGRDREGGRERETCCSTYS